MEKVPTALLRFRSVQHCILASKSQLCTNTPQYPITPREVNDKLCGGIYFIITSNNTSVYYVIAFNKYIITITGVNPRDSQL